MQRFTLILTSLCALALLIPAVPTKAAQLQLLLPLGRTLYQTNEIIDISAIRSDTQPLAAGQLVLTATGADGSKLSFTFPVESVPLTGTAARATENLHLNGYLMRPGSYVIDAASDGATAQIPITIYSSIRKSTYKTVHWGGPSGAAMIPEGEDGLGFNLILSGNTDNQEPSIAGGSDVMGVELMGGGHQHDLKQYNDWSDPNVYIGSIQRGLDRAFSFRTMPNAIGAHLHDEPGLTWLLNPHTGVVTDQDVAPQRAAYARAFGHDAIWSDQVDMKNPAQYAQWTEMNDFKLGFMDAFWKASAEDISRLKPGFLAVTQSQYAWWALYDGYYFNVARSMPVISGHGGYDDNGARNLNPSCTLEMALPRQLDKPTWFLPEWGNPSSDDFRLEHNMCFMTGIQGMSTPPGISPKSVGAPGLQESNQLFQKIGTIFTVPEYTNQDVAVLYSKSNLYYEEKIDYPDYATIYIATKLIQYPMQTVLDEDVEDGSLAANHKAVIVTNLKYLDPPVLTGLEDFIKGGGTVLETGDCTLDIPGAVKLGIDPDGKYTTEFTKAWHIADPAQRAAAAGPIMAFQHRIEVAQPVATAIRTALTKAGIRPTFESSVPTIAAGRQTRGDIDYIFAVNFTCDPNYNATTLGLGTPIATTAKITLPDDGRPVYNAATGKPMPFKNGVATLEFGPGQMYVLARPIHPIGGVQVGTPVINRDYTRETDPQHVEITASLVDDHQKLIAGNTPMEIKVTDPQGAVRYDVFRCAQHGQLDVNLPIAANDPSGSWSVMVTELLDSTHGVSTFTYKPTSVCGVLAGKTQRAVVFGADIPNIYRFFRDHRSVTIVPGSSPYDADAAKRLVDILKPYNVTGTIESLDDAKVAHALTDEEAATWCGNQASGQLTPEQRKSPAVVGFNVPGPTIVVGNAADNPLIAFMQTQKVLPYKPTTDFPGNGHGMVAWNLMCLGHDVESLALIGNDEAGVNEAVGTAFQIGIGVDPLTPYVLPVSSAIVAANMAPTVPVAATGVAAK